MSAAAQPTLALIGNPNCGKSTLFNAFTGQHQRVGNWPGVTVDIKQGALDPVARLAALTGEKKSAASPSAAVTVVDLPGCYTLAAGPAAVDHQLARQFIQQTHSAYWINVVDATLLQRHLYLTSQLLEFGRPMAVVLNKMDMALAQGINIDVARLAADLGCPVWPLSAQCPTEVATLLRNILQHWPALAEAPHTPSPGNEPSRAWVPPFSIQACQVDLPVPAALRQALEGVAELWPSPWSAQPLAAQFALPKRLYATTCLAGEAHSLAALSSAEQARVAELRAQFEAWQKAEMGVVDAVDTWVADAHYRRVDSWVQAAVREPAQPHSAQRWGDRLDGLLLHDLFGVPLFLLLMYGLFCFAIGVSGVVQDSLDVLGEGLLVQGLGHLMQSLALPNWAVALVAEGLGRGVHTAITFLPVIMVLFFSLAFLEESGYMPRAAVVMDQWMRALGLPGTAIVPMIIGLGCNVPAVLATRTLPTQRDRLLTALMMPLMSCSARLAIYAVFAAAFFPRQAGTVIFLLYVLGVVAALITGWGLRKTVLPGACLPLVLELPPYQWPRLTVLMRQSVRKAKAFVWRAGGSIVPICVLLSVLHAVAWPGHAESILAHLAQQLVPLFGPIGIKPDNWPAVVGLLSGVVAKEVVLGTLNSLYGHLQQGAQAALHYSWDPVATLQAAWQALYQPLLSLGQGALQPVAGHLPAAEFSSIAQQQLHRLFSPASAFGYCVFVLLYFPCISTLAALAQEFGRRWALLSLFWSTVLAYVMAAFMTMVVHKTGSLWSVGGVLLVVALLGMLSLQLSRWQQAS